MRIMNIQDELQVIHHKYGVSEKANYEIQKLFEKYVQAQLEVNKLVLADVSGSLLTDTEYWKRRCQLAEKCIEESPCDPDITSSQIEAHYMYNYFLTVNDNDR